MPLELVTTAFECRISTWRTSADKPLDIEQYMDCVRTECIQKIKEELQVHRNIKVNLNMDCSFENLEKKEIGNVEKKEIDHAFQLENVTLDQGTDLSKFWSDQKALFSER